MILLSFLPHPGVGGFEFSLDIQLFFCLSSSGFFFCLLVFVVDRWGWVIWHEGF